MDGLPGFRAARLVRAVVHDGYAGMDGIDEGFGVGQVESVVVDQIEVDRADEIVRADEGNFLGLGQVAEIQEAEIAEGDKDAGSAGILRVVESHLGSEAQ